MDHLSDPVFLHIERGVKYLRGQVESGKPLGMACWLVRTVDLACALAAANRTNHPEKGRVLRLMNWCRAAERAAKRRAA